MPSGVLESLPDATNLHFTSLFIFNRGDDPFGLQRLPYGEPQSEEATMAGYSGLLCVSPNRIDETLLRLYLPLNAKV